MHCVKVGVSGSSAKSHIIKPDSFCVAETPLLFSPQPAGISVAEDKETPIKLKTRTSGGC